MSINGKRDDFSKKDFLAVAGQFGIRGAGAIMEQVAKAVAAWAALAVDQEVPKELRSAVQKSLRLGMVTKK